MTREDERFYKAVISLQGNPDFETVRDRIRVMYSTICQTWYRQQPDQYARFAGQAQALANVMSALDPSKAISELEAAKAAMERASRGNAL